MTVESGLPTRTLIVISGLPGTGKSAVAEAVAADLAAVHLSIDTIEDGLLSAGLPRSWETGVAAYEAARAVAEQNLTDGRVVVVDAVNDGEAARDTWRRAASRSDADLVCVLLVVADAEEHRRRLATRVRPLTQVPEPTWEEVQQRAMAYEPWADCASVDADAPLREVTRAVMAAVTDRKSRFN